MFFLSPYWLFAASAILVPIAIHLWNKRQGKTVKVGSLRWLEASASKRWSSIRLKDVWLLVLRCFILILLAGALAKPVWVHPPGKQKSRNAVYVGQELLYSTAIKSIKPAVDSLLQRGYTLHHYALGFAQITQEQWQALSSNPNDSTVGNGNHWALLPAMAQHYPQPQDSVWLFTSDQQRHFKGAPTAMQQNIIWIPVALEATTTWLQAAIKIGPDSIQFILGNSTREGTTFSRIRSAFSDQAQSINVGAGRQVRLQQQGDSLWVHMQKDEQKVFVRNKPLRVSIVSGKAQQADVKYLQAAIQAISNYTGIPITMKPVAITASPDTAAAWLFWLSSEELPQTWKQQVQQQGTRVWLQKAEKPATTTAHFASAGGNIKLRQLSKIIASDRYTSLWLTSSGEPLLTKQPLGKGAIYHFRSGFSPRWSQLGQSAQLPELLLPLLLPQAAASVYDVRALDEEQLKPTVKTLQESIKQESQQSHLIPWLVLAAFILFLAERLIATKRATA
ncbi:BatA domain-containing protein [Pontibacter ruber]|uniref:BatA domain-containing protein n=1 Tax=Pontibacter ruber TaxID=1343895 RepID=A0ABW5CWM1_9BACT|nr:BatA domain-containing protein [Pontibacter ruber]